MPESVEANAPTNVPELGMKAHIARLLSLPGVYRYFDVWGNVLCMDETRGLRKRVSSYFSKTLLSLRIATTMAKIVRIDAMVVHSETEALPFENNFVKALAPRYNILFRDDKSYPCLKLVQHAYLRMTCYRDATDHRRQYFGLFPNAHAVREGMRILQEAFQLHTCKDTVFSNRAWPCLLYQIHHCNGPRAQAINTENYARDTANATSFLQGRQDEVVQTLQNKIQRYAESLVFRQVAIVWSQIGALSTVFK